MTNQQHPITPPPELVRAWIQTDGDECFDEFYKRITTQAAEWGADQELEACVEHLKRIWSPSAIIDSLYTARRPKPPSLKEQALQALGHLDKGAESQMDTTEAVDTIRRALEQLDD